MEESKQNGSAPNPQELDAKTEILVDQSPYIAEPIKQHFNMVALGDILTISPEAHKILFARGHSLEHDEVKNLGNREISELYDRLQKGFPADQHDEKQREKGGTGHEFGTGGHKDDEHKAEDHKTQEKHEKHTTEEKPAKPCKRQCYFVVSFEEDPKPPDDLTRGDWNTDQHSYRVWNGGPTHFLGAKTKGGNCLTSEWTRALVGPGTGIVRWSLECWKHKDSGPCEECKGTANIEGYYRSLLGAFTWEGWGCGLVTLGFNSCRSNALATDAVRFLVNEKVVFQKGAAANSGSDLTQTAGLDLGLAGEEDGIRGEMKLRAGEVRHVKTGAVPDSIAENGGATSPIPGVARLIANGKVSLTTAARAAGSANVLVEAWGIFGVFKSDCAKIAAIGVLGGLHSDRINDVVRHGEGFLKQHGYDQLLPFTFTDRPKQ
jgi:hypothetical protein